MGSDVLGLEVWELELDFYLGCCREVISSLEEGERVWGKGDVASLCPSHLCSSGGTPFHLFPRGFIVPGVLDHGSCGFDLR